MSWIGPHPERLVGSILPSDLARALEANTSKACESNGDREPAATLRPRASTRRKYAQKVRCSEIGLAEWPSRTSRPRHDRRQGSFLVQFNSFLSLRLQRLQNVLGRAQNIGLQVVVKANMNHDFRELVGNTVRPRIDIVIRNIWACLGTKHKAASRSCCWDGLRPCEGWSASRSGELSSTSFCPPPTW